MSDGSLLALDLGGTKLSAALADSGGHVRAVSTLPTNAELGAVQAVERILVVARDLVDQAEGEDRRVQAVGVATMGITEPDRVRLAPSVPGWEALALPGRLRAALPGLPVKVGNDVKAATLAELTWGTLRGVGTGLYVNVGTGLACGLVVGHGVVEGAHGAAGEIGYLMRGPADARAGDGVAPLEELVGGRGVARWASDALGRPVTMVELVGSAPTDPAIAAIVERLLEELAVQVVNLAIVLDPEVVVMGGGLMRAEGQILERLRVLLARRAPFPPVVEVARFGADASLVGAVALALAAAPSGPTIETSPVVEAAAP